MKRASPERAPAGGFGRRLREARIAAGLTQADVERASGVPKTRLSRYENGHLLPSLTTLAKLAEALGVAEAVLLGGRTSAEDAFLRALRARGVSIANARDAERLADQVVRVRRATPRRRERR